MLDPQSRRHLLESLRPPLGYDLDCAVGTSFSLDLLALLMAPLAFTVFEHESDGVNSVADPLALLETLRRYANRVTIFCQAGRITVPRMSRSNPLLYGYLERSIIEVSPKNKSGVFHPKVWALRFVSPDGPVRYRLLCLSRNLTFDRSWDTALVLEGVLAARKNAFSANKPLGDFFAALPGLAIRDVPKMAQKAVSTVEHELRRVIFESPEGFEPEITFLPVGIRGASIKPFDTRIDRMLVVSPFVRDRNGDEDGFLSRITSTGKGHILVSRNEELDGLRQETLERFERVYVLDSAVDEAGDDEAATVSLSGLHAKLYVADAGWNATVWTGSANATDAAFSANVEFLVRLSGKKSGCGIQSVLGAAGEQEGFLKLLREYRRPEEVTPVDPRLKRLEKLVDGTRRQLFELGLKATVELLEDGRFNLTLTHSSRETFRTASEITVTCRPITLNEGHAVRLASPYFPAVFSPMSFEALTSFFAFNVAAIDGDFHSAAEFVLNLPLVGVPADREDRILRTLLATRGDVLRFMLMLLAEGGSDAYQSILLGAKLLEGTGGTPGTTAIPLFETLVRALAKDPAKLDRLARLVEDLQRTPEGRDLLPEGFEAIWKPLWKVRERRRR